MEKIPTTKERILEYASYKGLRKERFIEELGGTYGNFTGKSKKSDIGSEFLAEILLKYPEINLEWLVTGEGEKDKKHLPYSKILDEEPSFINEDRVEFNLSGKQRFRAKMYDLQTIPLFDSNATLGLEEVFHNTERGNVLEYLAIPNLPKSDGAIFMTGDSMYPLLKSGDIAILKIIDKGDFVPGDIHYVEYYGKNGSVFKTIKYVKRSEKGDSFVKLVAYNTHHDPDDIEMDKIKTIAILNASVRYNRL